MTKKLVACLVAFGLLSFSVALAGEISRPRPELRKVTDRVYCASGYALGNVIYIITDKSTVVVDTTESPASAKATLQDFRKICSLPISYIIYTHSHGDHIRGARALKQEGTRIIAQKEFPTELAKLALLAPYQYRIAEIQFGGPLAESERGVSLAFLPNSGTLPTSGYVAPDILFDEQYTFEEGGTRFELYHTQGETLDHLMVWLPRERILLPGDLYYNSFPMLASPMKPDRPVLEWARSLERMRKLKPEYLVPSHWEAIRGAQEIDDTLANYARAIRFVHDAVVKGVKDGLDVETLRRKVRLPDDLARLSYLQERYGKVEWAVAGIYRQYTGWYDFDPARLNPGRSKTYHKAVVEAAGVENLLRQAGTALNNNQSELALQLTELVLGATPDHGAAHALAARALHRLADSSSNTVEINVYRVAAREHERMAEKSRPGKAAVQPVGGR